MRKVLPYLAVLGLLAACDNREYVTIPGSEVCKVLKKTEISSETHMHSIEIDEISIPVITTDPAQYYTYFACPDGEHKLGGKETYDLFENGQGATVKYINIFELIRAEKEGEPIDRKFVRHEPTGAEPR